MKNMLPVGVAPTISTLLVWRLTNLAIEAFYLVTFELKYATCLQTIKSFHIDQIGLIE